MCTGFKVISDYLEESSETAREGKLYEMLAMWKKAGSLFRARPIKSKYFFSVVLCLRSCYTNGQATLKLKCRARRKCTVEIFTSFSAFHAVQIPLLGTNSSLPAHVPRAGISTSSLHP